MEPRLALPALAALTLGGLQLSLAQPASSDVAKPGTIVTVAGTGTPGYSGDNGPATQAQLRTPNGLAFDAAGNLFIAEWDPTNDRVRKVGADGTITTIAGTGQRGFSGDGGKATVAQLHIPVYLVVDGAGNLFISDFNNHRVRKVTPDGIITTSAGSGPVDDASYEGPPQKGGFSGDNGPATDARLNAPAGLAVDPRGDLFIADFHNNRVRKVDAVTGMITTVAGNGLNVAGNGSSRSSGDGGPATQAGVAAWGLAIDAGGDLFVAEIDNDRVRKIAAATGIITTVAGTGQNGFSGDGGKATEARLNAPAGLAVDSAGNLFIADFGNYRVRKVDAVTGIITTVAGIGKKPYAGDGGLAMDTGLRGPLGVAIDAVGNLLISDSDAFHEGDGLPSDERVLKVFGVAAPGLLAGMAFPMPKQP